MRCVRGHSSVRAQCAAQTGGGSVGRRSSARVNNARFRLAAVQLDAADACASARHGSVWRQFSRAPQTCARAQSVAQAVGGSIGRRSYALERNVQLSLSAVQSFTADPCARKALICDKRCSIRRGPQRGEHACHASPCKQAPRPACDPGRGAAWSWRYVVVDFKLGI